MNYRNAELKIDQLVSYLNEEKINLSPAFQRGHVWKIGTRKKLLRNMIQGKPIPAIFLYKEEAGSKYSYNILDGKQRLESVILYIADGGQDLRIRNWRNYFFNEKYRHDGHFSVEIKDRKIPFASLGEEVVRDFREYAIPTIEISLDEETSLDEIISLFVDINQQGVAVNRFDIVKAMCKKDPLLRDVFALLAQEERRGQDVYYKVRSTDFTRVLKNIQVIEAASTPNAKVDRMWERLLEIVLFFKTDKHRKPVEILKGFISSGGAAEGRLSKADRAKLRTIFGLLRKAYRETSLASSRLAKDQTHFYTMVTSLAKLHLDTDQAKSSVTQQLVRFGNLLDGKGAQPKEKKVEEYIQASTKQTTDVSRRVSRGTLFLDILQSL